MRSAVKSRPYIVPSPSLAEQLLGGWWVGGWWVGGWVVGGGWIINEITEQSSK